MAEPLFLSSVLHEKIWGGNKLETIFGLNIPSDKTGEYWGISGHQNGLSTIKNGHFKGWTLDQLYLKHPELFNDADDQQFPLLTKILDANDWLSVQVHPDDAYALEHEGELGKTECWYILEAKEGAEIILGHHAKTRAELESSIDKGEWETLLKKVPVKAGDFFYVPSGTLHAIGPGIVILETQQSSDTTYRVYDFDRLDSKGVARDLHLADSKAVTSIKDPIVYRKHYQKQGDLAITRFMSNSFFTVEKWELDGHVSLSKDSSYKLFTLIDGVGEISVADKTYPIKKADNFILPSDVTDWQLSGQMTFIMSEL
ncbi:mannose-6-phosphate isomerase, class I [Streptococcus sp. zg-JUN1979]|uniref:mannose-6-phosphate isomerase, class I n=1 Tax=Streptococcus sp. zg-JUN1979 TaxID=3391450 RepID=UPI0039A70796